MEVLFEGQWGGWLLVTCFGQSNHAQQLLEYYFLKIQVVLNLLRTQES